MFPYIRFIEKYEMSFNKPRDFELKRFLIAVTKVPPSFKVMHVHIATSVFHKKRFKNEWIYVKNYDIIFITCDEDNESNSCTLKEVDRILHLNETCKGMLPETYSYLKK
ncbi:hypothetical protein QTP88_019827 [Uroleucon formosanum]